MILSMGTMESDEKLIYDQIKDAGNVGKLNYVSSHKQKNETPLLRIVESKKYVADLDNIVYW